MTSHAHDDYPDYPFEEPTTRKRLPIPDLRFEQVYLKRIQDCVHIEPDVKQTGSDDAEFTATTHVTPFLDSSQQVVRVDWGKIAYITLRDQVMIPLLQGILWGIVGTYYRPFVAYARRSLHSSPPQTRPVEGGGVGWLRSWLKSLGFASITVGPPSL